uniref:Uncharacterized protein n=1 Tax=Aegilops tauschii subsp. strangulata TaxID=200361 RepID=A0A453GVI4_AEGTS
WGLKQSSISEGPVRHHLLCIHPLTETVMILSLVRSSDLVHHLVDVDHITVFCQLVFKFREISTPIKSMASIMWMQQFYVYLTLNLVITNHFELTGVVGFEAITYLWRFCETSFVMSSSTYRDSDDGYKFRKKPWFGSSS